MQDAERVAALERRLAARDKTITALMARVEALLDGSESPAHSLPNNLELQRVVARKTAEVRGQHHALEAALGELKAAQAELVQAQKLTAIGQLAAGIAHEINTPAQYVNDNTVFLQRAFASLIAILDGQEHLREELLAGTPAPEIIEKNQALRRRARLDYLKTQVPRAIDQSLEGLHRITNIVRAMKDFSHPSAGQKLPVNLAGTIETTLTVARNEWKYVADVETDFDPALPDVPCLRDELNQVILNLVINAAHAIAEVVGSAEKGRITVSTRRCDDWAEIRVRDTGCGIAAEHRDRVYDPFFTTKPPGKGTGQGLAIARSVVVGKHGGQISFESAPGAGTTFLIRLPLDGEAAP